MYKVQETDDLKGLLEVFLENGLEISEETPESVELIKCWEIRDDDGERIAGLQLEKRKAEYLITGIYVESRYRKKGLGKILVDKAAEEIKALGGSRILLVAKVPDFFRKLGFEEADTVRYKGIITCDNCEQLNNGCFPSVMTLNL